MWRTVPLSRIRSSLLTDWSLNTVEIQELRNRYGINDLGNIKTSHWHDLLINTLKDPMIWFLIGTSLLFAGLKNYYESTILFLAIIPLIGMDFFLHWRTQASTKTLKSQLATTALVIRDGIELSLAVWELVPGDLVIINPGTIFPADGLIIAGDRLQVDESSLTGESMPVKKTVLKSCSEGQTELSVEQGQWGFAGTRLLIGRALMRVVFTGDESLYGQIIHSALQAGKVKTPLQQAIAKLVLSLIIMASLLCIVLAIVRYFQGFGLVDAILSAATLAVAALPDEFPVVFTFFLSVGVYRLARKKALVRRAVSVENLGRINCICSDKTGTITDGRLQLAKYFPVKGIDEHTLLRLLRLASHIDSFDLLDLALINEAERQHIPVEKILHTFPFTEDRKRETAIITINGHWLIASKGAPETILSISNLSSEEEQEWLSKVAELADQTYKVIACARMEIAPLSKLEEPTKGYEFMGLVAFIDPVREGVKEAIALCHSYQIHVLMVTGDHPATAAAVAREIGLGEGNPRVILGQDLADYLGPKADYDLRRIDVIARAIPMQKYEVVVALQARGDIVAVTGDGVNDVPALKVADIGIAMGERGTQSAREVSDIVLLDDNFDSITNAIVEGKRLFKNLRLCFKYLLMIHFPFIISAALIPLLGFPLLYDPIHIVFIELIIHPTSLLIFQDLPQEIDLKVTKSREERHFFSYRDRICIIVVGLITTVFISLTFIYGQATWGIDYARTLSMAMLSFMSVGLTLAIAGFKTRTTQAVLVTVILGTILLIQLPLVSDVLNFVPLSVFSWIYVLSCASLTWIFTRLFSYQGLIQQATSGH